MKSRSQDIHPDASISPKLFSGQKTLYCRMLKRLFIALELPEGCRETLADLAVPLRGVRWLPANHLHLTIAFLGDVPREAELRLRESLAAVRVPPFTLPVKSIGTFGNARPTVIWAGVGTGHPHLFALHKRVHDALFAARFDPKLRPFHPHITLARLKEVSAPTLHQFLRKHESADHCRVEVTTFALFSSRPGPEGSDYTVEERYDLRAKAT